MDILVIAEIFSKLSCSKSEEVQLFIITALSDIFRIIQEEPNGNCLFRALSRGWFRNSECYANVRVSLCDYFLQNSIWFEQLLPTVLFEYIKKFR